MSKFVSVTLQFSEKRSFKSEKGRPTFQLPLETLRQKVEKSTL